MTAADDGLPWPAEAPGDFDADVVAARLFEGKLARVDVRLSGHVVEVRRGDAMVVIAAVSALRSAALHPYFEKISTGHVGVVVVGPPPDELLARVPSRAVVATLQSVDAPYALAMTVDGTLERVELRMAAERRARSIRRYRYELSELIEIARALTQERNIERLLELILTKSRYITGADAGSIYVVEGNGEDARLRFMLSQNESISFPAQEITIPVSTRSIAGAAVVTRRPIDVPDVYAIGEDQPFAFDPTFDERIGYRTKSMIAMPMISAEEEVIGVIQLINKKRFPERRLTSPADVEREVIPFDSRSQDLLATLASQAGIALENALLYEEVRTIFEGFVRASVSAIEQRDPTTSGHSLRVSVLSVRLAELADRADAGPLRDVRFTRRDLKELEYAALLHDFGKIGVREQVLAKAKKLHAHELEQVRARFAFARKAAEADVLARKLQAIQAGTGTSEFARLDEELAARLAELDEAWRLVLEANEPTVLRKGDFTRIAELGRRIYMGPDGPTPLLLPSEIESLQITKGTLTEEEIAMIRSHVVHTRDFLSRIPWGKSFLRIPEIAGAHHEKLNGKGYPDGLVAEQIPIQSKIMAIADIYDALTARDRPYKRAVPVERALAILDLEVRDCHIDADLVQLFVEAEVYRAVEKDLG
jgi:HD-GYP domain-containing protein (c-di-GMP phosphodiesterase class II)